MLTSAGSMTGKTFRRMKGYNAVAKVRRTQFCNDCCRSITGKPPSTFLSRGSVNGSQPGVSGRRGDEKKPRDDGRAQQSPIDSLLVRIQTADRAASPSRYDPRAEYQIDQRRPL